MKKSKMVSIVLMVIVALIVIFMAKDVFAATSGNIIDITNTITSNNTTSSNTSNTSTNSTSNLTVNNTTTKNTTNVLTTTNTSSTNNTVTTLPKTGVEDSIPAIALVVVLAISAVYAYKKIKLYKDI